MKENNKDRNVVIMLEDKNNNIDENIYLSSISGFVESINDIEGLKIGIKSRSSIQMKSGKERLI